MNFTSILETSIQAFLGILISGTFLWIALKMRSTGFESSKSSQSGKK